jgi:hypothetical protein
MLRINNTKKKNQLFKQKQTLKIQKESTIKELRSASLRVGKFLEAEVMEREPNKT